MNPSTRFPRASSGLRYWGMVPLIVALCYLMPFLIFFGVMGASRPPRGSGGNPPPPWVLPTAFEASIPAMFAWPFFLAITWLVWTMFVRIRDRNRR